MHVWTGRMRGSPYARLAAFALAAVAVVLVWRAAVTPWVLIGPGIMLLLLVARHDRVIRARNAAGAAIASYERGLARIDDRWVGTGRAGHA